MDQTLILMSIHMLHINVRKDTGHIRVIGTAQTEKRMRKRMRLIDADVLENQLEEAISLQGIMALALGTDDELEAEVKAYRDILNGVREQATIPYDMKWNPDCEDCLPEGIEDCIECHKRTEGR